MTGCYVYNQRVADDHMWENGDSTTGPWEHGQGPLCIRCGLPRGTVDYEEASDAHYAETGHRPGTGACERQCGETGQ